MFLSWPLGLPASESAAPRILVLGDSISAAHGVATEDGWVAQLRRRLEGEGYRHTVINASVGGDTTSGGLARLPKALEKHQPTIVVIELGGNDGLRGLAPERMQRNLEDMIEQTRAAGARPLLLGVRLPPNYGPAYVERFMEVYRDVAERKGVPLVPRMLEGVGERRDMMLQDGIHPNAQGHARIVDNVWPKLEPLLDDTASRGHAPEWGTSKEPRMNTDRHG